MLRKEEVKEIKTLRILISMISRSLDLKRSSLNQLHSLNEDKIRHTLEDEFSAEIKALKDISDEEKEEEEDMNFELKMTKEDVIEKQC